MTSDNRNTGNPLDDARPDAPADRDYDHRAVTGESGYGAGETGSTAHGSAGTGISSGVTDKDSRTPTLTGGAEGPDPNAELTSRQTVDRTPLGDRRKQNMGDEVVTGTDTAQQLGDSGMGALYSEANANAGDLVNSDSGQSTGYSNASGGDEARRFRTSADPEYGERQMGYGENEEGRTR